MARLAGAALLAVPFLPLPLVFGEIPGGAALVSPATSLLGLAIFGTLALLLARVLPARLDAIAGRAARAFLAGPRRLVVGGLMAALALLLVLTGALAFRHRPLLVDSVVQLFQAEVFASGRLAAPVPPLPEFFLTQHVLMDAGGWYAQYPPGHSALLALGVLAGAAWAVPVALTLGTAFLLQSFARRAYDETTARLTLLLTLLCPFFWFMGASFMNHVSALFAIAAFLRAFVEWEVTGRARWMAAAGAALGAGSLSRPLDCAAVGAVFGVVAAARLARRGGWRAVPAGAAGFLGLASLYLAYNAATTGDPLLPGYIKLWGASHGMGFHESPWGDPHTALTGLRNELVDLSLLAVFLFEWPIPALLPLGVLLAAGWARRRWDLRLLAAAAAVPAVYFFYWHRDAFLGPRYLYAALAFLLPLTARAVVELGRRLRGRHLPPASAAVPLGRAVALLGVLAFGYALAVGVPQRFVIYQSGMRSMKVDLAARASAAGLERALVFVPESWGSRLLARLRGRGVPASLAERAYRRTDHCELEELVRAAERQGASGRVVAARVERLMRSTDAVAWHDLNGDPTLRLRPVGRLTTACLDEVLHDRRGYSLFTPYLPLAARGPHADLLVARDLRHRNALLRALHPERSAFLWRGERFERLP